MVLSRGSGGGRRGVSDEACRNAHKTDVLTDNACVKRTALIFRMSPGHVFFLYIYASVLGEGVILCPCT